MKRRRKLHLEHLEGRALLSADLVGLLGDDFSSYSVDGSGNNPAHPEWGSAGQALLRTTQAEYGDGVSTPAGADRASPRAISNLVAAQSESIPNGRHLTDFIWIWGQFIDHDLDLTVAANPAEPFPISVPPGDPFFDPAGTGTQTIPLNRSNYDPETGGSAGDPRQQINSITAWVDGSMVYGSDAATAANLRLFEGGRLKTSDGDLLPLGPNPFGGPDAFLAGDVRVNENAGLIAIQTLWVREHNQWADRIAAANPSLSDEEIYQRARAIVIGEIQAITYNEFLPALLGEEAIRPYAGYDPTVNPGISNVFSTAAFRVGHTLLSPELLRLDGDGEVIDDGNLALRDAFFATGEILDHGLDSLLRGAAVQRAQEVDNRIVDDVRNFLFGPPGAGGFDLASLNIQRGRDHGLADYNQTRIDLGLAPAASFADISSDPDVQARLEAAYGDVNNIDVWVGALAEDHVPGGSVGELIRTVLVDQFERLRAGDPNWYQNAFSPRAARLLDQTTLAEVIERNTGVEGLQTNVFYDPSVLYFKTDGRPSDVGVIVDGDSVDVVDQRRGGRLLESMPLAEVEKLILVGGNRAADRFTVSLDRAGQRLADGMEFHGGHGPGDRLTVLPTRRPDRAVVNGNQVLLNEHLVEFAEIEQLNLPLDRRDRVVVASPPAAQLLLPRGLTPEVLGPNRPNGNRRAAVGSTAGQAAFAGAASPLARQLFEQLRGDLLRQAQEILSAEQFRAFAAGLARAQENGTPNNRPNRESDQGGSGNGPNRSRN